MPEENKNSNGAQQQERDTCGVIMPISGSDGYPQEHWVEVKSILFEVITDAGLEPNLVSDSDEVGIIHNRIVENIYENPIVICDVSSKNANVMFELGLRLAFDKAAIIVKDNVTTYSFDTSPIEHLTYPKDLRYKSINDFKLQLKAKIAATLAASKKADYSTFLKHFAKYKRKIEEKEVGTNDYIVEQLKLMQKQLDAISAPIKARQAYEEVMYNLARPGTPPPAKLSRNLIAKLANQYTEHIGPEEIKTWDTKSLVDDFKIFILGAVGENIDTNDINIDYGLMSAIEKKFKLPTESKT